MPLEIADSCTIRFEREGVRMPNPPQRSSKPALAPHVQAAVARSAQARMAESPARLGRPPAPHLEAALRAAAQPKMAAPGAPGARAPGSRAPGSHPLFPERSRPEARAPGPSFGRPVAQPKMAPHVQAAILGVAQRKASPEPANPLRRTPPAPAPGPSPRAIQRMLSLFQQQPDNVTGEDRSTETVTTAGGVWTAIRYVAIERLSGAPAWGASMHLDFTPLDPVDATKIALVQTVLPYKNGAFYFTDKTTEKRSFAGSAIDQHEESRSPLYADAPDSGNSLLGSSSQQENAGRHGYRYFDKNDGEWKHLSARLRDTPHFRGVTSFSSQTFETTALAVEGNDRGTYYGSVRWGWRSNGKGKVQLDPLSVVSQGSVSAAFKMALRQWNGTKTSTGLKPQPLPEVTPPSEKPENVTFTDITNDML